jgi:hypothetical protein
MSASSPIVELLPHRIKGGLNLRDRPYLQYIKLKQDDEDSAFEPLPLNVQFCCNICEYAEAHLIPGSSQPAPGTRRPRIKAPILFQGASHNEEDVLTLCDSLS